MENRNHSYDVIIIGFGKGGKTLAAALGKEGKKTALIERSSEMYGGTCINEGCIPTKFLAQRAAKAKLFGGSFEERSSMYTEAIGEKEALVKDLREKNFQKVDQIPAVTVITGSAKLVSPHEVEVAAQGETIHLKGNEIVINTGSVSFIPPINGLKENPYIYTSRELLRLNQLPKDLVIIGGGYIGVEFASIYANFGSNVTILQDGGRFLPREDSEIAEAVKDELEKRGVQVITGALVQEVEAKGDKAIVTIKIGNEVKKLDANAVLVAAGRRPNTGSLGLENAGVELNDRGGVATDSNLRTAAPHIYAMGDVTGGLQFTYISLDDYRIVYSSMLGDGKYTADKRGAVPYSVFLNPPFSRIGMGEEEAREKGFHVKVARLAVGAIPKARVLEQTTGILKAIVDEDTGKILGAHLFCEESHEMINLIKLAIDAELPYTKLRDMIYTHPTMSEAFNDLFNI